MSIGYIALGVPALTEFIMQLLKIGAIKTVEFPSGWIESSPSAGAKVGLAWERVFSNKDYHQAEIVFKYRGVPIDEASRKVLNFLFGQIANHTEFELDKEQILALHTVFGVATIGDNQYTNSNTPGSLEGPRFHLEYAAIQSLSGRPILRVKGDFANGSKYDGIFYLAGGDGRVVEEFFLQRSERYSGGGAANEFIQVLNSIVWN